MLLCATVKTDTIELRIKRCISSYFIWYWDKKVSFNFLIHLVKNFPLLKFFMFVLALKSDDKQVIWLFLWTCETFCYLLLIKLNEPVRKSCNYMEYFLFIISVCIPSVNLIFLLSLVSCLMLDQELHQHLSHFSSAWLVLGLFSYIQPQHVDVNAWNLNEQFNIFHNTAFALYQRVRWDWLQTTSHVIDVFSKA